jgi:hypothetical protein
MDPLPYLYSEDGARVFLKQFNAGCETSGLLCGRGGYDGGRALGFTVLTKTFRRSSVRGDSDRDDDL